MRLLGAIAVSVFLFGSTANAATYYVATTGDDAASGSLAAPFRTIKQATRVVRPGDVVNVRGGVYYDSTHAYQVKGTAAARITIRSMPGELAILDGSKLASGTTIVNLNENEYVDFSGFEVRNAPYIGVMIWHGRNVRVLDNHVHHARRYAIYAGGETTPASFDITISGNRVHDAALENQYHTSTGGWPGAVVVSRTERSTITNNKIWNSDGEGLIWGRSTYTTIRGNEIFDTFSVNLYINNGRFATVDRNLVYSTGNSRYYRDGKPAAGIGVANEIAHDVVKPSSDNVFTNNIVIGTRWGFYYGAFDAGGGLLNTKVLHNTFYGTTDEIVRVENDTHSNSTIANNIFYQTGSPAPKYSGAGPVTYRNNLWYGGTSGVAAGSFDLYADPLFARAGGRASADYKLGRLSPAIHTALDVKEVATDFFGNARTPSSDIGAHEESISLGSSAPAMPAILAPGSVTARVVAGRDVRVTWTAVAGAVRYDVYRDGQFFRSAESNQFVDTTVAPLTSYTYQVSARDLAGNESARSAPASATTPAAEPSKPQAPSALQALASRSQVTLSWAAGTGATSWAVYRDGAKIADVTAASYVDAGLKSSTTYTYHVVAVAPAGTQSAASEPIAVTTTAAGRRRSVR